MARTCTSISMWSSTMMLLAAACLVSAQASSPLLLTPFTAVAMKNMTLQLIQNPGSTTAPVSVNVGHVRLAPCGMLSMHSHADVDEVVFVLDGKVTTSLAYANGTITTADVPPFQAFALPQNLVHTVINANCNITTSSLHIFNSVNPAGVSVAAAAWALPGSPYQAYGSAGAINSELAAQTFFAYDPVCLAKCGLGPKYGQQPAAPCS